MVRILSGAVVALLWHVAPSLAAIDCDKVRNPQYGADTHAVVAYLDLAAGGGSERAAERLRRNAQSSLLDSYLDSLKSVKSLPAHLLFVVCARPRPAIDNDDVAELIRVRVALALSRDRDGPDLVFAQAVIPQVHRRNPPSFGDLDVFVADASTGDLSPNGWEETIRVNSETIKGLLSLALGVHQLNLHDGPTAKLLLCKSRSDLHKAGARLNGSPQSDKTLFAFIEDMLKEAEPLVASARTRIDPELLTQIKLAGCPQ